MNKIKIGVIGCLGKMGQEICNIIKNHEKLTLVETIDGDNNKEKVFQNCDAIIDFSSPEGLKECLELAKIHKKTFVSGSTPMNSEIEKILIDSALYAKICWSANFSITIMIMKKVCSILAKSLNEYDCEIIEAHHKHKKDSPSGTAILLGREIAKSLNLDFEKIARFSREGRTERRKNEIGFSSIRGGNVFGEHEVMFLGEMDSISIKHIAYNRKIFALGAIESAIRLFDYPEKNGLFTIEDLFEI